jgi:hypothetical protein
MRSLVLRIIVIERCSVGGCPLEEASEHCFLSTKVLFWYYGFIYCVVSLLFFALFLFSIIIIDLVPYKWYQSTFLGRKLWIVGYFFQGRDIFRCLKATYICCSMHKSVVGEAYM